MTAGAGAVGDDLNARIRARDREAIAEVMRAYLPQLLRAPRGAGLDAQSAEEVTQETFTTFVESAHRFEGRSHVRTWLFGILAGDRPFYREADLATRKAS